MKIIAHLGSFTRHGAVLFALLISASLASATQAVPGQFSYEGRVYDSGGSPSTEIVRFKVRIFNPAENCLLFEETHPSIDLSQTAGTFALDVGAGTPTAANPGLTLLQVFSNTGTKVGASSCTYTPADGHARKLEVVIIDSGSTETALSPKVTVSSVPFAMVAGSLEGRRASSFIGTSAATTQSKVDGFFGVTPGAGQSLQWNGSSWDPYTPSGGSITSGQATLGSTDNAVIIRSNNIERMRVDMAGSVGIGTTTPLAKLHVTGAILAGDDATCNNTKYGAIRVNASVLQVCLITDTWSTISNASTITTLLQDADGDTKVHVEKTPDEDTIRMDIKGTEVISIVGSGGGGGVNNVTLNVKNGATSSPSHLRFSNTTGFEYGFVGYDGSNMYVQGSGTSAFSIKTNGNNERLRVNAAGEVGIGTTSPVTKLHVAGAILPGDDATCDSTKYGAIRVNSNNLQVCLATNIWANISTGAGTGTVTSLAAGAGLSGGTITSAGTISLAVTGVSAGSYSKVNVDTFGRVTMGMSLNAGDIPSIDAVKIAFGTIGVARLPDLDAGKIVSGTFPVDRLPSNILRAGGNAIGAPLVVGTNDYQALRLTTGSVAQVTIDSSGFVGIGTATPTTRLDVQGNVRVAGRIDNGVLVNSDGLSNISADFSNSNIVRAMGTSGSCGTLNVVNIGTGGTYTVSIPNATATCATIQLNGSPSNVRLDPYYAPGATTANGVVYTFLYDGLYLWMSSVGY